MLGGEGFFPPVEYSPVWGILGLLVVVAVVAFYLIVTRLTRQEKVETPPDVGWIPTDPVTVQQRYIGLIEQVEREHANGVLTVRAAQQQLSLLLRRFALETSGLDAPRMTLAELRGSPATALSDAVARLYPGEFGAVERGSVVEAAAMARQVVRSWN